MEVQFPERIIFYCPCSFGGTFDYAVYLVRAILAKGQVVELILPKNANFPFKDPKLSIHKILPVDRVEGPKVYKKMHFLFRAFMNPIRLSGYLRDKKNSLILLNDFEQLSAKFWVPKFLKAQSKSNVYGIYLHDPDRDAYPPNLKTAQETMALIMSAMDLGFYHEILVDRPYYKASRTTYVSIPHGAYLLPKANQELANELVNQKEGGYLLASITGNIRPEKNYHLAIEALKHIPNLKLIIAGRAANSGVDIGAYKKLAANLGVEDRIIWLERFVTDAELGAIFEYSDIILLAYSSTFKSQSAVFASLIPYKPKLVASDGESALAKVVRQYQIGELVTPDSLEALVTGIQNVMCQETANQQGWQNYAKDYSWETHADIILSAARKKLVSKN